MKTAMSAQMGQQLNLTPQLLQSIRLLQLDGMQLELEVRRALENNPLLELEDVPAESEGADIADSAGIEVAAFDELPESSMWDVRGAPWTGADDDRMARVAAGESTDPHWRVLQQLALELPPAELAIAAFWLEQLDDAGYLQAPVQSLREQASAMFDISPGQAEQMRQRLLHGEYPGLAAADLEECLLVQLANLPGRVPARQIARNILQHCLPLLAVHDQRGIAAQLGLEEAQIAEAIRLILSLQPRPGESLLPDANPHVIPDVVAWHADCAWRVALNPHCTPKVSVAPQMERLLASTDDGSAGTARMRELLQEARWLTRGLSIRYDTLLRAARAIVERQAGFLSHGDEAMAPLTLKEIADQIGMHESTISRITTGKYIQTPRGTFELKHFFAVRLEGANVSGPAVRAMVRRLIDAEPANRPLADEAIAGLLARQGIHIARRTVAKYREQLNIAPARERRQRGNVRVLAKAG